MTTSKNNKEHIICSKCGSEYVSIDAIAVWNYDKQLWEIEDLLEYAYCDNCNDETYTESVLNSKLEEVILNKKLHMAVTK